jgi:uncharacterized protein (DUF1330 family)
MKHELTNDVSPLASLDGTYIGTRTTAPYGNPITLSTVNQVLVHLPASGLLNLRLGVAGDPLTASRNARVSHRRNKRFLLALAVAAAVILVVTELTILILRAETPSPKGYVIAEVEVTNSEAFKQYAARVPPLIAKFGGKYLVRGGQTVAVEGSPPSGRVVVIEFDSLAAARAFQESSDYQAIAPRRWKAARSRVFRVEGTNP